MFDDAAMNNTDTDGHIGFFKSAKNQMVRIPANSVKRLEKARLGKLQAAKQITLT